VIVLRSTIAILVWAGFSAFSVNGLDAQERIRLTGGVQWIGGTRMQVMTDGGATVAIDLREAGQTSYQALRVGERVVVDGVVASDRSRVIARDIRRDAGDGSGVQSP